MRRVAKVAEGTRMAGQRLFMENAMWDISMTWQVSTAAPAQARYVGNAVHVRLSVPIDELLPLHG